MRRESDQHSPRQDDELKSGMEGMLRSGGPTHAEEWAAPEPPADDDPDVRPFEGGQPS
ncbi:MAG: hypothetical protein M3422_21920 [Actinomycetota bacterium]|nr:hypothetical protein [Actinomycetota bacterium]